MKRITNKISIATTIKIALICLIKNEIQENNKYILQSLIKLKKKRNSLNY